MLDRDATKVKRANGGQQGYDGQVIADEHE